MAYTVALCGLSAREARLVEIVVTRAPNLKHPYRVISGNSGGEVQIALLDTSNPQSEDMFYDLRVRNPNIVGVYLSDLGLMGNSRYRIERKSLLLRVLRVFDEVVENELQGQKVAPITQNINTQQTAQTAKPPALPAAATEAVFIDDHAAKPVEPEYKPLLALVVDDSLTVREQLRAALQRVGIEAELAENAEVASHLLQSGSFDLAFLDVVMPGIDGYELCRRIKQNPYLRRMPILMLTSRSSPFDRARGALAGCDTYLVKPLSWQTFFGAVDKALDKAFQSNRTLLAARGYKAASAS
jgi:two-component system, cell cycle response regulator